jgi:hypothetical protein
MRHLAHDRHPATSGNWDNDLVLMIWTDNKGPDPAGSVKFHPPDGSKVSIGGNNSTGIMSIVLP